MNKIVPFRAEKEAGLAAQLAEARVTLAACAAVDLAPPALKKSPRGGDRVVATNEGQPDLHYLKTCLASVGWNKNNDVFLADELWAARGSPVDKPFNHEHDQADIIGHITASHAEGPDGPLDGGLALDELPASFDVYTCAVLYKRWVDQALQERMDRIVAEIDEGKWFVSMEAWFAGFDYALEGAGVSRLVARNEETAFLSKHLRAYGGDGTYEGLQVGRALRNITFAGKGLVRNPANPASVIFSRADLRPFAQSGYVPVTQQEKATAMSELDTLKAKNAELTAQLAEARQASEEALAGAKAEKAEADKALTAAQAERDAARADSEKSQADATAATAELRKERRGRAVTAALKIDDAKAASILAPMLSLSDEDFEQHLKALAAALPGGAVDNGAAPGNTAFPGPKPQAPPKATPAPLPPKSTNKADGTKLPEHDPADANADPAALNVKPEGAALAGADGGGNAVAADILAYLSKGD